MTEEQINATPETTEKGKKLKLLKTLCFVLSALGWIMIFGGLFWVILILGGQNPEQKLDQSSGPMHAILYVTSAVTFDFFFVGLAAIVLANLTMFILDKNVRPAIILRCAPVLLYTFAVFQIYWAAFQYTLVFPATVNQTYRFLYAQPALLPTLIKAAILVLVAQMLKRLLPIIDEYKTLV